MSRYLRRQSVIDLLRNALHIYRRHFVVLFLASAPLDIPFSAALGLATSNEDVRVWWMLAALFVYFCTSSVAGGVMTVLLSDVCVGNRPGIPRAYGRVFGTRFWPFFGTALLANSLMLVGVIIPLAWFLFVPPVVILEGLTGRAALARSKRLGQGYHLRSFAFIVGVIAFAIWLDTPLRMLLGRVLTPAGWGASVLTELWVSTVTAVVNVLGSIFVVLLYYDLRARKEAYDNLALAEDLRR